MPDDSMAMPSRQGRARRTARGGRHRGHPVRSRFIADISGEFGNATLCDERELDGVVLRVALNQLCELASDKMTMQHVKDCANGACITLEQCAGGNQLGACALNSSSCLDHCGRDSAVPSNEFTRAARAWRKARELVQQASSVLPPQAVGKRLAVRSWGRLCWHVAPD